MDFIGFPLSENARVESTPNLYILSSFQMTHDSLYDNRSITQNFLISEQFEFVQQNIIDLGLVIA